MDQADNHPSGSSITRREASGAIARGIGGTVAAAKALVGGAALVGGGYWLANHTPRSRRDIPSGRTVIDYWEKWTGPEGLAIQQVVDQFNQSQTRIWVRRTAVSEIDTKAMVAIGGGDPPDVCGVFSYNIAQYAQAGAVIPLSDFAGQSSVQFDGGREHRALTPAHYAPAVAKLLSSQGKLIAGVSSIYSLALYYNKAMFRAAGLDPDSPPQTIEELDEYAQRLTIKRPDGSIEQAGFLPNLPAWWPYSWPLLFGANLYDPDSNTAGFASEQTIRAYQWVRSCSHRFGMNATAAFATANDRNYHSAQDPFISGKVAMIAQGPWLANFIGLYNPHLDYAAAALPVASQILDPSAPVGMLEADVLVIPRGCKHPEAAYEFIAFTQRQEVQEQLAREHTKSSPLALCSPDFFTGHRNPYVKVHDAITRSARVSVLPQTTVWKSYAHLTAGVFDAAWKGNEDILMLCRDVNARVQAMMDRDQSLQLRRRSAS